MHNQILQHDNLCITVFLRPVLLNAKYQMSYLLSNDIYTVSGNDILSSPCLPIKNCLLLVQIFAHMQQAHPGPAGSWFA